MAAFNEVGAGSAVNVSAVVGAEVRNVSRNGTSVYFEYRAYMYQNTNYYSNNTWALWVEGYQNNVKGVGYSSQWTKYYTGWYGKSISLGTGTSSTTISIGVNGNSHNPSSAAGWVTLTLSGLPTASAPSVSALTISDVSDKSAKASFTVTNSNNASVTASGIQLSETNFGTVVKTISGTSGSFSDLIPNKTYYARGYATNAAGTTRTGVKSFTTSFVNPGSPSNIKLTYNESEPIQNATYTINWTKANNGSTAVAGYRVKVYKNNTVVKTVDTESVNTTYNISGDELSLAVGDVIKFGIYAYCKDWNNGKHLNGGGSASSELISSSVTIVSDKYIYVSLNGQSFEKRKMFISLNGASFVEVKKEKFKVIK